MLTGTVDEVMDRMLALGMLVNPEGELLNASEKFKIQTAFHTVQLTKGRTENLDSDTFDQAMMLTILDFCGRLSGDEMTDFLNIIVTWVKPKERFNIKVKN